MWFAVAPSGQTEIWFSWLFVCFLFYSGLDHPNWKPTVWNFILVFILNFSQAHYFSFKLRVSFFISSLILSHLSWSGQHSLFLSLITTKETTPSLCAFGPLWSVLDKALLWKKKRQTKTKTFCSVTLSSTLSLWTTTCHNVSKWFVSSQSS